MSQENVDTLERALASANPGALLAILDESVEWDYVGAFPEAVTYHGPAEVGEFLRGWASGFDEFGFEADETIDAGDCVAVSLHQWGRGKETGARVESAPGRSSPSVMARSLAAVAIPPKPRHSRPSGCRSRRCRRRTSRWSERASSSGGMRVPAVHRVAPHPSCGGPLVVDRRLQREGQLDCDVRALSGTTGHAERSAERLHPVGQAHQAGAVRGIRSAHAVIANR